MILPLVLESMLAPLPFGETFARVRKLGEDTKSNTVGPVRTLALICAWFERQASSSSRVSKCRCLACEFRR